MKRDGSSAIFALRAVQRPESAVIILGPRKTPAGRGTRLGQEAAPDHNLWINARPLGSRGPTDRAHDGPGPTEFRSDGACSPPSSGR